MQTPLASYPEVDLFAEPAGVLFRYPYGKFLIEARDVAGLILALQHYQRTGPPAQSAADGTVAVVLLQNHLADAPGDFG